MPEQVIDIRMFADKEHDPVAVATLLRRVADEIEKLENTRTGGGHLQPSGLWNFNWFPRATLTSVPNDRMAFMSTAVSEGNLFDVHGRALDEKLQLRAQIVEERRLAGLEITAAAQENVRLQARIEELEHE